MTVGVFGVQVSKALSNWRAHSAGGRALHEPHLDQRHSPTITFLDINHPANTRQERVTTNCCKYATLRQRFLR